MNAGVFLLYLATWTLVALTPGPAVLCAMTHSSRYGFRQSLPGIVGIQCGHFVFFGCIAGGLAALLAAATTAFTVLRLLGAAYLLYLGLRMIVATFRERSAAQSKAMPPARSSLWLQGFAIQITNPKALLFMSALLPQFIDPHRPLSLQLVILLAATVAVDVLVLGTYAYLAARGSQSLRNSGVTRWLERIFGGALVLFGLRLFATRK